MIILVSKPDKCNISGNFDRLGVISGGPELICDSSVNIEGQDHAIEVKVKYVEKFKI